MVQAKTLPEALLSAARGAAGYTFVEERDRAHFRSYAGMLDGALRVAGALAAEGLERGARVAIILPGPEPFLTAFLGASAGGFVPVPLYPPIDLRRLDGYLRHVRHILAASSARAVLTSGPIRRLLGTVRAELPGLRSLLVHEELEGPPREAIAPVTLDEPAFVQFTSGSTSAPKGVVLTHANLDANIRALGGPAGIGVTPADVGVSWLPLFHDMGLIGMALASLYFGVRTTLMPPQLFLRHPVEWLRALSARGGTISFAPSFAYAFCTRRVTDADLAQLDLSAWRVAGCGSEPIHPGVLQAFARRFAPAGFREAAWLPCYGMAEHTLAVTFPRPGTPLGIDTVDAREAAHASAALPVPADDPRAASFVSCGRPFPGHELRIVDAEDRPLGDRLVGEIVLAGPSVMRGYEGDPELTASTLRGGWLHTGDLGYLAGGELHVCGRRKDMIIVRGRNYYPQDIEWAVSDLPGLRRGAVVAFGTDAFGDGERLVVVVETREPNDPDAMARAVRQQVLSRTGLRVHEVVVGPPGTIAKTSSGKPRRFQARAQYEDGTLTHAAPRSAGLLGHLVASQWGHLRAALRGRMSRTK